MKTLTTLLLFMTAMTACGTGGTDATLPPANPAAAYVVAGTPTGTCLLKYNDSLRAPSCCYALGAGANTCDTSIACNARTGAGCCKIYSTRATTVSDGCCLYEGKNIGPDREAACAALLAGR